MPVIDVTASLQSPALFLVTGLGTCSKILFRFRQFQRSSSDSLVATGSAPVEAVGELFYAAFGGDVTAVEEHRTVG